MHIVNAKIWTPQGFKNGNLSINGKTITHIGLQKVPLSQAIDAQKQYLLPGLIDLHVNGAFDLERNPKEALARFSLLMAQRGVTSFLPTLISAPFAKMKAQVEALSTVIPKTQPGASCLGLHLEGPFLNPIRRGAHPLSAIQKLSKQKMQQLVRAGKGSIKIITLAPELDKKFEVLAYLKKEKIIPAMGHSNATYQEGQRAIQNGYQYATHLFNAMRPWHHREPGLAGAVLNSPHVFAEIIADGAHIAYPLIETLLQFHRNLILISDEWVGFSKKGKQTLTHTHQLFQKKGGSIVLFPQGILGGSTTSILEAIKRWYQKTKRDWTPLISLATMNPARVLGIDHKMGSLQKGKQADLILVNQDLKLTLTIAAGKIVYQKR